MSFGITPSMDSCCNRDMIGLGVLIRVITETDDFGNERPLPAIDDKG